MNDPRNEPATFQGAERRKIADRRRGEGRREMIRFEPDKDDRRSNKDRRKRTGWDIVR